MHRFRTIEEYVSALPQPLCDVGHAVLPVVAAELPEATGALWHGHPTWRVGKQPVCQLKAYTRHLTFALWGGTAVEDPSGRLKPADGQELATVKLRAVEDVDPELFASWLRQVRTLAG